MEPEQDAAYLEHVHKYQVPDYVRNWSDFPADERERYFKLADISDPIRCKLFDLLCESAQAVVERSDKARVYYQEAADHILTWASHASNVRNLPGFPRGEETLRNHMDQLLGRLQKRGLALVETVLRNERRKQTILLLPPENIPYRRAFRNLEALHSVLEDAFQRAAQDYNIPLPEKEEIELQVPLNPAVPLEFLSFESFNRREIALEKYTGDKLIVLTFPQESNILLTPDQLQALYQLASGKFLKYVRDVVHTDGSFVSASLLPKLNLFLQDRFPHQPVKAEDLLSSLGPAGVEFRNNYAAWSALARKLVDLTLESETGGDERQARLQALYLMYAYLAYERHLELEEEAGAELLQFIYEYLVENERAVTRSELINWQEVQYFANNFSWDSFETLFSRFLETYSIYNLSEDFNRLDDGIMVMRRDTEDEYYIHVGQVLALFMRELARARDRKSGVRRVHFVEPWSDMLSMDRYDPRIEKLMESDLHLFEHLRNLIASYYPLLFDLYEFFLDEPDILSYLCNRFTLEPARFFDHTGQLKTLPGFLEIYRLELLRKAQQSVSRWYRFWLRISRLFRRRSRRQSLWPVVRRELHGMHAQQLIARQEDRRRQLLQDELARGVETNRDGERRKPVGAEELGLETRNRKQGEGPEQEGSKRESTRTRPKRSISKKRLKELYQLYSEGWSKEYFIGRWNTRLGEAAKRSRNYVNRVVAKRIQGVLNEISEEKLEEYALDIAADPRFDPITDKKSFKSYVILMILEALQRQG